MDSVHVGKGAFVKESYTTLGFQLRGGILSIKKIASIALHSPLREAQL